jgi:diacylglycerol kinase (ATP)
MEKYLVVYNPTSGKEVGQQRLFQIAKKLLIDEDISMTFISTKKKGDAIKASRLGCSEGYDMIIACGGDGTINEVVNGIMQSQCKTKLAILPTGTINDFASYMQIPTSIADFTKMLKNKKTNMVDVGIVNNQYFINVVSGGAFTNIPHEVPSDTKTIFGKYAYYFQAALEIPNQIYKSYNLKVESSGKVFNIDALVFIVSNTPSIGGFKKLSPDAKYNDGLFDVVIFEKTNPLIMLEIFTGMASGDHVNHPMVHYFKTNEITIDSDDDLTIDIDGEYGFKTPVNISLISEGIELLVP